MAETFAPKPPLTTEATQFLGVQRQAEVTGLRPFENSGQPHLEAAVQQRRMRAAIDSEKFTGSPVDRDNGLAQKQMEYVGRLVGPEVMQVIKTAAVVENQIRDEVMAEKGLTGEGILKSDSEGRKEIYRDIDTDVQARLQVIADLWVGVEAVGSQQRVRKTWEKQERAEQLIADLLKKGNEKVDDGMAADVAKVSDAQT